MFRLFASLALAAAVALPGAAFAHSAIFDCFDNGDGTVSCQGGYSDGSSASGVSIKIKDAKGDVLRELKLDSNSEVSFPKGTTRSCSMAVKAIPSSSTARRSCSSPDRPTET